MNISMKSCRVCTSYGAIAVDEAGQGPTALSAPPDLQPTVLRQISPSVRPLRVAAARVEHCSLRKMLST